MAETKKKSVFEILNAINCNEHTEKKNGLTYLSWPYAWAEVKKAFPDATYEVLKFDGKPYINDDKFGIIVYTKVTIEGLTHEMWLPVMDGANNAMKSEPYTYEVYDKFKKQTIQKRVEAADMFDINKTIMRCLVKNLGMFGCGLYIYAGEDLPDTIDETKNEEVKKAAPVLTQELYDKLVAGHAEGILTKTGKTMREYFMYTFKPTQEQMDNFDLAVHDFKRSRNA